MPFRRTVACQATLAAGVHTQKLVIQSAIYICSVGSEEDSSHWRDILTLSGAGVVDQYPPSKSHIWKNAPARGSNLQENNMHHLLHRETDGRADRQAQGRQRSRQSGLPSRGRPTQEDGRAHAQTGEGIVMIDDDRGMSTADFPAMPGTGSAPGSGPSSRAVSSDPCFPNSPGPLSAQQSKESLLLFTGQDALSLGTAHLTVLVGVCC